MTLKSRSDLTITLHQHGKLKETKNLKKVLGFSESIHLFTPPVKSIHKGVTPINRGITQISLDIIKHIIIPDF